MEPIIPQLDIGKRPHEELHVSQFLGYPVTTPFGNLALAEIEVIRRIDYVNLSIEWVYRTWQAVLPTIKGFVPVDVLWIRFRTEDVIYSLRKIFDTFIAISYILGERETSGVFPRKIAVDSIGRLLKTLSVRTHDPRDWAECYATHQPLLQLLNDISNSFKHGFANHETVTIHAREEPSAYYFITPQNESADRLQLKGITISALIHRANLAIQDIRKDHQNRLAGSGC